MWEFFSGVFVDRVVPQWVQLAFWLFVIVLIFAVVLIAKLV